MTGTDACSHHAQADGPRGLPALPAVPQLGLPDMPAIALPADAGSIVINPDGLAPILAPAPAPEVLLQSLRLSPELALTLSLLCCIENSPR